MLGRREGGGGAPFSLPEEEEGRGGWIEEEEEEMGLETERFPSKTWDESLDEDGTRMSDPDDDLVMGEGELGVPGTFWREDAKAEGGRGVRASWNEDEG